MDDEPAVVDVGRDAARAVGRLETDRFCEGCGYNLHGQLVFREPHTALLVSRCPECGRLAPAGAGVTAAYAWLRRLGTLLLFIWIVVIIGVIVGLASTHVTVSVVALDEFTWYRPIPVSQLTGGYTNRWNCSVKENYPYWGWVVTGFASVSAASGFLIAAWMAVTMHHWRRRLYITPVAVFAVGTAYFVWLAWSRAVPQLGDWCVPYLVSFGAAHLLGGIAGTWAGRPLARLAVRIALPPGLRPMLAFLWRADGLPMPR